jgi:hypothetical protein
MILATALSLLLAVTTYPYAAAMGAVYDSPIVKKMSPIQRVLEQRRLDGDASCTRTTLGNITTICEESSGITSSCNVYPDSTCSYAAVDLNGLEDFLEAFGSNMTNMTIDGGAGNVTATDEEDALGGLILVMFFYILAGSCECADSIPDCSMTNIADYQFNACTADAEYTYTCELSESDGEICCDIVDSKGEMNCCRSETEASIEYECTAGSDSSMVAITETSCTATYNGESCTCEYCNVGEDIELLFVGYDCSAHGGQTRACPDPENEDDLLPILDLLFGSPIERSVNSEIVDPRPETTDESASNGMVATFAMTVTTLVFGLLF